MERQVPLWVLLLSFLLWALFLVVFSWSVRSTTMGSDLSGRFGQVATAIASFPSVTKQALTDLKAYADGSYVERSVGVRREESADYTDFEPVVVRTDVDIEGLLMKADRSRLAPGWRLMAGTYVVDGSVQTGAILLSPDLEIVRNWHLDEIPIGDMEPRPPLRKVVHGMDMMRDGSLVISFDGGSSLQRFGFCGEREWAVAGRYHHTVTLDDTQETVWTLLDENLARVSTADGTIVQQISMDDVVDANPDIDILEIRMVHDNEVHGNSRNTEPRWLEDVYHFNDVDPLPASLTDAFPQFERGDVLISSRSINLVFVLDPDDLKIKWWRMGTVQRQHDPDWLPNGQISIFNNRMSRDYSEIVMVDPDTFEKTVTFDGRKNDFYTRIRGKHQVLDNGNIIVSSPQQGRIFEVTADGETVLDIVNTKPGSDNTNFNMSEMKLFPTSSIDPRDLSCTDLTN